jgi:transcriptional regulator with XRE-family HTH domain
MKKTFADKLKEEREQAGLSLDALAKQIDSAKSYIWELENKESSRPSADKVFKLAEVFNVSPEYLLDETGRIARNPDRAFFSKFQKLSPEHKKTILKFMDSLDE